MRTLAAVLSSPGGPTPYADSRPLAVVELELDPPGPGELLLAVQASGVCHSDLSVVDGRRPRPVPMALGHEASALVEAVGPGVDDVRAGDHVVCVFVPSCGRCPACTGGRPALCPSAGAANRAGELRGGGRRLHRGADDVHHHLGLSTFATHAVVDHASVVVVPRDVPWDVAALFGCAMLTGGGAVLRTGGLRPGQAVGVWGLGGVGMAALLAAVAAGAGTVVAVDPVPAKRELALELGAVAALDPSQDVRDVLPGGVDVAVEASGRPETVQAAFAATAVGGTTVATGLPDPSATLTLPALPLVGEARTLVGSYMGSAVPAEDVPRFVDWWRRGRLPVERLCSAHLPLADVNAALDALDSGRAVRQILLPGGAG